ncbi:hypothetical protein EV356DRAFT_535213 [Viridothelium virens]|uniref:Calponin-homology (CH) domain-containing protein n=1 Tax=Viridothelium virens TaxID=1048519 RepID=A0A6A6H1E1_VIRVR|nr:hypothetical protein EV356DRAFT_535213 [Viridothelium virens]
MASVSSLDQDMKKLRLGRYTPQAANAGRAWIESTLGEKLPPGDLLETLKDGVVLCRLANLAVPSPGIRFKKSPMPFMQMENISHFLKACELPPLNLPSHDRFLTVDLYESKDPAQVLQCLGAFSRAASRINPSQFPTTLDGRSSGTISPEKTGPTNDAYSGNDLNRSRGHSTSQTFGTSNSATVPARGRTLSPALTGDSNSSKTTDGGTRSPTGPVSSWSRKGDQGLTTPAWNIHQYGYMGGASQGNQGIAFGARRQITTAAPHVPSMAEKERKRKEKEAEEEKLRLQAEEAEQKRRVEREAKEEQARIEEERRWEEETRRLREQEQWRVEEQKRQWEEQEKRWKEEEEQRQREERAVQEHIDKEAQRKRAGSDARLKGQFLSQYQKEQSNQSIGSAESERVRELERQLAEAKERERQYQLEREERLQGDQDRSRTRARSKSRTRAKSRGTSRSRSRGPPPRLVRDDDPDASDHSWAGDEREFLRQQWKDQQPSSRPLPDPQATPKPLSLPSRPLPEPSLAATKSQDTIASKPATTRPLPDPSSYASPSSSAKNSTSSPPSATTTSRSAFAPNRMRSPFARPSPSPTSTTSPPSNSNSNSNSNSSSSARPGAPPTLLEREKELERQRQREWEENQKETAARPRDRGEGMGEGQTWDVNQYGWLGGDSQNRGGQGIGFGGRRQILGPRPRP